MYSFYNNGYTQILYLPCVIMCEIVKSFICPKQVADSGICMLLFSDGFIFIDGCGLYLKYYKLIMKNRACYFMYCSISEDFPDSETISLV